MNLEDEPIEYVRGFTEFLGCKIDLSKKPLIPRPETEFWVEKSIAKIYYDFRSFGNCSISVLDMFAGSGCIGIAILKQIKNSKVVFADRDRKCLEQIKINLKINLSPIRANCSVVESDVFSNIKGKYDYIFANPPYIPDYRKNPLARLRAILRNRIQKSVLDFEPKGALFGGVDGLFYIRKFLKQASWHLNPCGRIFMEFSLEQKKSIEKLLQKYNYKVWEFNKDQYGKYRWVVFA